ncbi:response regulator transcription factor [Candidatus Nitrospira neomarina]|uniref:Response regulator transcription factor n=1 Tax=Candidatus Nitrospira neomarina TaxID=3020899 RepID=A0AA96K3C0_9BACT|nr:response regulator transcription factor [Candidatus Nitrospira neomarina]WNM62444.1 response regulator transcription factor [Candidatus Nitrospira neomarina]
MPRRNTNPIRLLLVDDHEVLRLGLKTLFTETANIQVVGEAGTRAAAESEADRLQPDVVLMDVRLPDGSGIEACREIRNASPEIRVLFLTSFADDEAVMATIMAGAKGFLLKEISGEELVRAVTTVAAGQSILDPAITQRVLTKMQHLSTSSADGKKESLAPQELKVLTLVAEGKTNKEIAVALDLSDKTVGHYLENIFQKLQVTRRSQAAAEFVRRFTS